MELHIFLKAILILYLGGSLLIAIHYILNDSWDNNISQLKDKFWLDPKEYGLTVAEAFKLVLSIPFSLFALALRLICTCFMKVLDFKIVKGTPKDLE